MPSFSCLFLICYHFESQWNVRNDRLSEDKERKRRDILGRSVDSIGSTLRSPNLCVVSTSPCHGIGSTAAQFTKVGAHRAAPTCMGRNIERSKIRTHYSAFDVSAQSGFFCGDVLGFYPARIQACSRRLSECDTSG